MVSSLARVRYLMIAAFALAGSATHASAADFTKFRMACLAGSSFLIGDAAQQLNAQPVRDALCPCLEAGFASYSQAEVDALEADLRTGTSDEARATYSRYRELQAKATGVLSICSSSDAVTSATRAAGL